MDCEHYEDGEEHDSCPLCRLENPEKRPTRVYKFRYWFSSIVFELLEDSIGSLADFFAKVSKHIDAMGDEDMSNRDAQQMKDSLTWLGEQNGD